jgi:CBS domain-containing protein
MIKNCMKHNVVSISTSATVRQAAELIVDCHIGLLPVVNEQGKPIGVIQLSDLLSLELPVFFNLLSGLDFVHDFGAVETTRPSPAELDCPVTTLMQPVMTVEDTCGLLRAYALMMKHKFYDLLVVSEDGSLVGIASHADIGASILSTWKTVETSKS